MKDLTEAFRVKVARKLTKRARVAKQKAKRLKGKEKSKVKSELAIHMSLLPATISKVETSEGWALWRDESPRSYRKMGVAMRTFRAAGFKILKDESRTHEVDQELEYELGNDPHIEPDYEREVVMRMGLWRVYMHFMDADVDGRREASLSIELVYGQRGRG